MNKITFSSGLLVLMFSLMAFIISGCDQKKASASTTPLKVNVVKIQQTSIPVSKDYIGVTSSMASVDIRARVEGFLLNQNFIEGRMVKKGELLFVIDPKPFEAQLANAKAQLAESIATAAFNKLDAQRKYILYKQNAASEQDADKAQSTYEASIATVEANKATVLQAEINLSYCYVYSPIDGKIGEALVDVGNLVGGTQQTVLATVVQLNPIYVSFNPSVNDYAEYIRYQKSNIPFKVEVTMPQQQDFKFNGAVDLVNNQAELNTSTLLMRSVVDNPANLLLPGIYVNVKLMLGINANAILVPSAAVMTEQTMRYVYVVDANNVVDAVPIQSQFEYNNNVIITSGLKVGDLVITNNLQKLRPGMKVDPVIITPQKS